MKWTATAAVLPLVLLAGEAVASLTPSLHHARIARRINRQKRCLQRGSSENAPDLGVNNVQNSPSSSTTAAAPSNTSAPPPPPPAPAPPPTRPQGTIQVESTCGDIGADPNPGPITGPNGSIFWLNCGVTGGGWNPPHLTLDQMIAADLGEVLSRPGNPFSGCGDLVPIFYQASAATGIPAIMIASIAMQESSCRVDVVGQGGEQGIMQITQDKCGGAPGGNCLDPWYNIFTGAQYLRGEIDRAGGNVIRAVGGYNGWQPGMTEGSARAAQFSGCCRCQNNLDYLHQFFNGWCQGVPPADRGMGVYFNLNVCG